MSTYKKSPQAPADDSGSQPSTAHFSVTLENLDLVVRLRYLLMAKESHQKRYTPMKAIPAEPKKKRERPHARRGFGSSGGRA